MLRFQEKQGGMTLIELMTGLVILVILIVMGVPSFSHWIQSSQIRNSAEAIQNGLNLARVEAVRRNAIVRFNLVTTTGDDCALSDVGTSWVVSLDDPSGACNSAASDTVAPRIIQVRASGEGSSNAVVNAGGVNTVSFSGTGRASTAVSIDITNPSGGGCAASGGGGMRCLRVVVTLGGQVRMCDPARASSDPQGC